MNQKQIRIIALLCTLLVATGLYAADDIIGQLAYVQGPVEIVRNGKILSGKTVSFGYKIHNFDQIRAGKAAMAEIQIDAKTGVPGVLKISPNSIVKMDITSMKKNQKGGIDLLAGSIDLKVQKMTTGNSLDVRTSTAVMGVRGTTFSVTVSPAGDNLLATDEGRVACLTSDGSEYFSEPGLIVEGSYDGAWNNDEIPARDLAEFRNSWYKSKVEAFRADPERALKQMAVRYVKFRKDFKAAYLELQKSRDVLKRWQEQEMKGSTGSTMENMKDKKALAGAMFAGRKALFMLEPAYLRLQQLEEILDFSSVGGALEDGTKIKDFLRTFKSEAKELSAQIVDMNYYVKLYAKRNDGSFPLDGMTGAGSGSIFD